MEHWLSLTVLDPLLSVPALRRSKVHISVPKAVVKLAVNRNRLKRVLREAVKLDSFFAKDRSYRLRVKQMPRTVDLKSARKGLEELHG